ncbi:ROK family protein [Paenibacillus sp. HN-1]|uniref:ROK family protein n=1 Tax=Paenibacillus TaxID=44249 RepID=UPI001CAA3753|nr:MULTISPECIES: ROK family protein [Paenibacillus]MBY9078424.1 ROK family protein [Paenibacillus sp. CGMCC 1.18879]MBY9087914.1 ROK family protein [Paenibacillus sinensis]
MNAGSAKQPLTPTDDEVVWGVDVGGTKVLVGAVSSKGRVIASQRFPMDRSSEGAALASIRNALRSFAVGWDGPAPLAIGAGVSGQTDPSRGIWLNCLNIPLESPVPLATEWGNDYGVPVFLDNDVNAATLAELSWGLGTRYKEFIYVNIGTGIGAGIVAGGRLIRGASNYAGELGHMALDPGGETCICGQKGCLEPMASGGGLINTAIRELEQHPESALHRLKESSSLHSASIISAADTGDLLASGLIDKAFAMLGTGIANMVNLLNPAAIVMGGSVMNSPPVIASIRNYVFAHSLPGALAGLECVELTRLEPSHAGLLGAGAVAWVRLTAPDAASLPQ